MKKNREFIQEILNSNLDTSIKGISEISKVKLKNIPKKKWNILNEDVQFPILTINKSIFRKNIDSMHMYASSNNIFLAPHSKTSMSPQLLLKIKNRGCWGVCYYALRCSYWFRNWNTKQTKYCFNKRAIFCTSDC